MPPSEAKLDQIVKGAPPPDLSPAQIAESAKSSAAGAARSNTRPRPASASSATSNTATAGSTALDALPSSTFQIYLNLLILESSLRLQYLSLRARLRVNVLLLLALLVWNFTFTYLLFFRPREDGSGVGGSVYWLLESIEKLGWCSGVVTLCLFWGTGMYERGVRWPRKFVGTTNRGLRGFNMKVVVVKGGFWSEMLGWISIFDPAGWLREERVQFQVLPKDIEAGGDAKGESKNATAVGGAREHWNLHAARYGLMDEDIAPAGDVVKLLLLPKPFSPDFREGWETYRMEYWDRENARRAELRKIYKARVRLVARQEGGWMWWTGWRGWNKTFRLFNAGKTRRQIELEKIALQEQPSLDTLKEWVRSDRRLRQQERGDHSRSSSRSTTPTPMSTPSLTPELDPQHGRARKPGEQERTRRGSSAGSQRRSKKGGPTSSRLSATETILQDGDILRPLEKRNSTISTSSKESEEGVAVKGEYGMAIKAEPAEL